jgi:chromosome segregation ATPase
MSIAINANDHSQELQSLLREFNTKAAEKGLLDISDPDNRALAELCRSVLRKADASARRTQYAKEAAAHKVTSPELDGARISYLNTRLEALNTNLASVDTKIQTEQTRVAELETFINQLKEAFERHSDHQKKVMEAFTSAYILPAERLAKLEEFYTQYNSFLMSLQGHIIPTIESRLASIEAKLNSGSGNRTGWEFFDPTPKWTCRT